MTIELRGGDPRYSFRYLKKDLLPQDQKDVLLMKFRIMSDDAVAQHIGLTDDQKQKLGKISTNVSAIELSQADHDKLVSLWQQYNSASDKTGPEKALLAALKDVGNNNLAATKQKAAERVDQIKGILSADQIKKFQDMNNGP